MMHYSLPMKSILLLSFFLALTHIEANELPYKFTSSDGLLSVNLPSKPELKISGVTLDAISTTRAAVIRNDDRFRILVTTFNTEGAAEELTARGTSLVCDQIFESFSAIEPNSLVKSSLQKIAGYPGKGYIFTQKGGEVLGEVKIVPIGNTVYAFSYLRVSSASEEDLAKTFFESISQIQIPQN